MAKDNPRGTAVVKVLKSDLAVNILETGLDAMLESGALKDIPLVNTIVGICGAADSVRNQLLTTKLLRFIYQLSEISQEDRIKMVEKLNEDEKFSGRVGSFVIEILDRMESEKKPELAAQCFASYARGEISFQELRRILFALERVPSFDINELKEFSKVTIEKSAKMDEFILFGFVNAGLGINDGAWDGGTIIPTSLCKMFVKVCK